MDHIPFISLGCIIKAVTELERGKKRIDSLKSYLYYGSLVQVKSKLKKWKQVAIYVLCLVLLVCLLFMRRKDVEKSTYIKEIKTSIF